MHAASRIAASDTNVPSLNGCSRVFDLNVRATLRQLHINVCAVMAGKLLKDWRVFPLPLDNLDRLRLEKPSQAVGLHNDAASGPTFYRCVFWVCEACLFWLLPQMQACSFCCDRQGRISNDEII